VTCADRPSRTLASNYSELLGFVEGLKQEPQWARSNWQSYCVRLLDRVDRRTVMQKLSPESTIRKSRCRPATAS
jgi:dTDP-4-amino-4,6-dideoxygalactose transaminase